MKDRALSQRRENEGLCRSNPLCPTTTCNERGEALGKNKMKVSTSTVAALFSKTGLTAQRMAMIGLVVVLGFPTSPDLPR